MSYVICEQQRRRSGADQPAHPRSLISAFVVRCLDSTVSPVSVTKISSLMLASVAEQASLSLTWSESPKDMFSHDEAHLYHQIIITNISFPSHLEYTVKTMAMVDLTTTFIAMFIMICFLLLGSNIQLDILTNPQDHQSVQGGSIRGEFP